MKSNEACSRGQTTKSSSKTYIGNTDHKLSQEAKKANIGIESLCNIPKLFRQEYTNNHL
jgi:hypothetical protein